MSRSVVIIEMICFAIMALSIIGTFWKNEHG